MRALLLVTFAACAHAPPAARAPQLSANLAPLGFYVGTWTCDGTQYDAKGATEHMALEVRVTPEYDSWLKITVWQSGKQLTSELKGIDGKGVYHHLWTSNDGSSGSLTSAGGWTGASISFDEDHPESASKTRMTFTKVDDTHYTHKAEVDEGSGYRLDFEKVCHKAQI